MPATNDILDELFEKARTAPAVISLSDLKEKLKNRPTKSLYANQWVYISLSCFIGLIGILTWYGSEHSKIDTVKHYIPMQENAMILEKEQGTIPKVKSTDYSVQKESLKKKKASVLLKNSIVPENALMDSLIAINKSSALISSIKKDSIRQDTTKNSQEKVFFASKERNTSSMVIYMFSSLDNIKLYQKRLADVGIRFDITKIKYDKTYHDNITELKANLYVYDTLYKSIHIKDFKELRIQWEIEPSGNTKMKSISILDKFYMLKKL